MNMLPGAGCSASLKKRIKNALQMHTNSVEKISFKTDCESYQVTGQGNLYIVQRLTGIVDGVCPGGHFDQLEQNHDDNDNVLETCTAYNMIKACQHTFICECPDYAAGNGCKHILLGMLGQYQNIETQTQTVAIVLGLWNPTNISSKKNQNPQQQKESSNPEGSQVNDRRFEKLTKKYLDSTSEIGMLVQQMLEIP